LEIDCAVQAMRLRSKKRIPSYRQAAYTAVAGEQLAVREKQFTDDGNLFDAIAGISPITHGPNATGAHTLDEAVPISELVCIARVYALTAITFGAS
jgi:acetylornithine deacetylase/succinyl-diaminopimelate desuccinylase-like protein